ncbi:MAG: hypothetical protein LBH20_03255 [Treponema sp.]|jgi:hypothetical protein|nr:hypothetical protein [Treponema sp.]
MTKKLWQMGMAVALPAAAALIFGMMAAGCDDSGGDPGPKPPEQLPAAERWTKWIDGTSTAELDYTVDNAGVCTVTVSGTADDRWMAIAQYKYTGVKDASYTYEFMARTESGEREIDITYYADVFGTGEFLQIDETITINTTWKTVSVTGEKIPKAGIWNLEFLCADQLGTFYVKNISIEKVPTLDGTWLNEYRDPVYKFNNGNYEFLMESGIGNRPVQEITIYTYDSSHEGTYTTSDNNLTFFFPKVSVWVCYNKREEWIYNCTKAQFVEKVRATLTELNAPDAEITATIAEITEELSKEKNKYFSETVPYTLSGNTLTLEWNEDYTQTLTRK